MKNTRSTQVINYTQMIKSSRRFIGISLVVLSSFSLSSCHSAMLASSSKYASLLTNKWVLNSILVESIAGKIAQSALPFINLDKSGGLSGFTACNNFNGSFTQEGAKALGIDIYRLTKKACPESNIEGQFIDLLTKVDAYEVKDNILNLLDAGKSVLSFIPGS